MTVERRATWGFRVMVGGLVAVPVALLVGALVASELRARRLAGRLVDDALALSAFSRSRPAHREPLGGAVADCLGSALDTAPDVSRDAPWPSTEVLEVRAGRRPLEALPASALDALTRHDPWLRLALSCSRREVLAPVPGLGPLADPLHRRRAALPKLQEAAAALAPLRVRLLVQHRQTREALTVCTDALALVSDLLWLEGPEASLGALGQASGVVGPCADALWQADAPLVDEVGAQLEHLASQRPPYAHVLRLERVAQELRMFGAFVSPTQAARLPPGAQSMVATASTLSRGRLERVGLANWWSHADRAFLDVIAAADLAEPARTRAILDAQRGFESRWLSLVRVPPLDVRYQMYAESHDVLPTALELLAATVALRRKVAPIARLIDVKRSEGRVVLTPKATEWTPLRLELPER